MFKVYDENIPAEIFHNCIIDGHCVMKKNISPVKCNKGKFSQKICNPILIVNGIGHL